MEAINSFLSHINWILSVSAIGKGVLLALAVYLLLRRPASTQSGRVIKGILLIAIFFLFVYLTKLHLYVLTLRHFLSLAIIVFAIVFQPEIRRALSYLGRMRIFNQVSSGAEKLDELNTDIGQIILAVKELAQNKFGALLVIERQQADHHYLSPGTPVNADISGNLILSICSPKTPLHDGAIVIQQGKIKAAGVILPITDKRNLSHVYGTRHRAALGLSEVCDCLCILVSEESGSICTSYQGNLHHYQQAEELVDPLKQFYSQQVQDSNAFNYPLAENTLSQTKPTTDT